MIESLARHIMKKICFSAVCFFLNFYCFTQDINVTFTPTGEATSIDSVTALNQRTKLSVTLPGDETLVLRQSTGIENVYSLGDQIMVYPNPFAGDSKVSFTINEPQKVNLLIQNMTGQVVAETNEYLQSGVNEFEISISENGFYVFVAETKEGHNSCNLVSLSSSGQKNNIECKGVISELSKQLVSGGKKSEHSGYSLEYVDGDNIHYTCYSGVMTTIFTDSTESTMNYDVEFATCTDPDGKNYDIVMIGYQTWMMENLSYLPISSGNTGSDGEKHYYVYDYNGTSVSDAKATSNYVKYGVLYNWEAAKTACPSGWHLPSDEEWKVLEKYLGMSSSDADSAGLRNSGDVGKKLKSTSEWYNNGNGDNSSGFNALPGGYRYGSGRYGDLGERAFFWSSLENGSSWAWRRHLSYYGDGVLRDYPYRRRGYSVRCLKDTE